MLIHYGWKRRQNLITYHETEPIDHPFNSTYIFDQDLENNFVTFKYIPSVVFVGPR